MTVAAGILQTHGLKEQSTYDAVEAFAAADAVQAVIDTMKIEPFRNSEPLTEAVGTASHQGEVLLDQGGKWSGTFYIKPQALGTPPDIGPAGIKSGTGVETLNASTSAVYTLSDTVKVPLQGFMNIAANFQKMFSGGVTEEMVLEIPGNGIPTISLAGSFARMGWVYKDVISPQIQKGASQVNFADLSRGCLGVGGVFSVGDDTNTGTGYVATSVDHDAVATDTVGTVADAGGGEVKFTSGSAHGLSVGDEVVHTGFTDQNYNGNFVVNTITDTTNYEVTATWAANDAGNWTTYPHVHFTPVFVGSNGVISSVTNNGGAPRFLTAAPHGLAVGDAVINAGMVDVDYNGYFLVTVVSDATHYDVAATFTADDSGTFTSGEPAASAISSVVPTGTVAGTALGAVNCGFEIDGIPLNLVKATIKAVTGWGLRNGEATSERGSGIVRRGEREVSGSVEFYWEDQNDGYGPILGRVTEGTIRDLFFRIGADTAAARMKIDINKARLHNVVLDPGVEVLMGSFEFTGRQNSAAADELIATFD